MKYLHFPTIDSTNAYLCENADRLEDMTFVSAAYQSHGKGREDRVWEAGRGDNLLFSLLIKKPDLVAEAGFLSLVAAVAVSTVLRQGSLTNVSIKWPNDIYVNGKKIAGILLQGQLPRFLVIGIGLNVNQTTFPNGLRREPTSVALELGETVDLEALKAKIYAKLEEFLSAPIDHMAFLNAFAQEDYLYGKQVQIQGMSGVASGVNDRFELLLETRSGIVVLRSGEIEGIDYP